MRRMFSKNQIKDIINESSSEVVKAIQGQDIAPKDVSASGSISGDEIIENMSGYSFSKSPNNTDYELDHIYAGVVKTGNKITFVIFAGVTTLNALTIGDFKDLGSFTIPNSVGSKLYPYVQGGYNSALSCVKVYGTYGSYIGIDFIGLVRKNSDTQITIGITPSELTTQNTKYLIRLEFTFLLSDNMIPNP